MWSRFHESMTMNYIHASVGNTVYYCKDEEMCWICVNPFLAVAGEEQTKKQGQGKEQDQGQEEAGGEAGAPGVLPPARPR